MHNLVFEVLNILHDYCVDDNYKVIDVNDIILGLPKNIDLSDINADQIFSVVEDLATDGTIDLKYRDEEDICLAITNKGRRIVKKERETQAKIEEQRRIKLEEEARQEAIRQAEEKAKREKEKERLEKERQRLAEEKARQEKEKQEKLIREKELEKAKVELEELMAKRRLKRDPGVQELQQKVEELESEVIEEKERADLADEKSEECSLKTTEMTENAENTEIIDYNFGKVKRIGSKAFFGGLAGAFLGNAIFWVLKFYFGF